MAIAFQSPSSRLPKNLSFRPIVDADLPFLAQLYASTRENELAVVPWSRQEKHEFLQSQFEAQHRYYMEQFKTAAFLLIVLDSESIGRVYIDRRNDEIRLIDIALLPAHRGGGLGSALLNDLLDEARQDNLSVRIHVEKNNPAMSLYRRLGFEPIADQGVYDLMQWQPSCDDQR